MSNIHTRAVLCKLSISQFNPKRQDAKTTAEVLAEKHAARVAGAWVKNLVDPSALEPITSKAQAARVAFYRLTVPWSDEGWRMLPITLYEKFHARMRECRLAFESEVNTFVDAWPSHVEQARVNLNGMFDAGAYPSAARLVESFAFSVNVQPIPAGEDFRVTLGDDELERIKADTDERVREAEAAAMRNVWERLAEPLRRMIDKLREEKGIFRNSLVENLTDILDLVPALNLTQDVTLNAFAKECREKLAIYSPDTLRINQQARAQAVTDAEAILKRMEGYL